MQLAKFQQHDKWGLAMIWLISIGCLFGGAAIGALLYKTFMSDEVRIEILEQQLQTLNDEHENYKSNVHSHFSDSAQLLNKLTDSYKSVYVHMAEGARALCPEYISSQLSSSSDSKSILDNDPFSNTTASLYGDKSRLAPFAPPLDYAPNIGLDPKNTLSDDYGLDNIEGTR
jgi:uncharacterized membrane-anchored protein YhcB (DUF1043 family)